MLAVLRQGRAGQEDGGGDETARELRAAAGVLVNELARPLLFLDLPDSFGGIAGSGEPACLSLHALIRSVPTWNVHPRDVFVCENPNLGGGGDRGRRTRTHCAPLVCTDGMPGRPSGRCCRSWTQPMPGCAITAISTGRYCHRRCGGWPVRRGALALRRGRLLCGSGQQGQ